MADADQASSVFEGNVLAASDVDEQTAVDAASGARGKMQLRLLTTQSKEVALCLMIDVL